MCFDLDSQPPIDPIAGGALDHEELILEAADGNRFAAFRARASSPGGAGIVILPDVRGLYSFYEELALRFAEAGIDALAFDYFGRTAGASKRDAEFSYMEHVQRTQLASLRADVTAAATELRRDGRVRGLYTIGFCFGGRLAYLSATFGLDLAGTIAFYGRPLGDQPGYPAPVSAAPAMANPVLGLFGGADQAIPPEAVAELEAALTAAAVEHELVSYPGAPHSFFDRKAADFADAAADSWQRTLAFIAAKTPPGPA
jgi:carboxymethylenebutenolidase